MKTYKITAVAAGLLLAAPAFAAEKSLQQILDDVVVGPGVSTKNVNDVVPEGTDSFWSLNSGGGIATFIIEIAGNAAANTFGIYDLSNSANRVQIFSGGASTGSTATIQIDSGTGEVFINDLSMLNPAAGTLASANTFGFYLSGPGGVFFSDSTLNAGGNDQMKAYQGDGVLQVDLISPYNPPGSTWGTDEFILAWEDLPYASSDKDYNDLVLMVSNVRTTTIPDNGFTLALLGGGLAGMGLVRRRLRK